MELTADNIRQKPANFIDDIVDELKIPYNEDSRQWVVGFNYATDYV